MAPPSFGFGLVLLLVSFVGSCRGLKYVWGDALQSLDTPGPRGEPYPVDVISEMFRGGGRKGRTLFPTMNPALLRERLLQRTFAANYVPPGGPAGRAISASSAESNVILEDLTAHIRLAKTTASPPPPKPRPAHSCPPSTPARLCRATFNTTAPMYGVSLTSGEPVTIVQKFPDLLQQVVFEVCETDTCDVVHGTCTQTYVPYLFLVIPLGPVTLTGQDYILVESGCVCSPKYAESAPRPVALEAMNSN